ncbi:MULTISPECIES: hypothetical protein [Flammeovirga]|uniref:DUF2939 domain-containing protein n=1 Tax=Flammeovirga agarivorans TaxID=2726742 RepID=A0A7X8SKF5_9BACT|nr:MULTISPECIES: hypothetical protein [Flammeovirga]NLR91890.1 hypothetical protein [Flammeovirga agarivorans]
MNNKNLIIILSVIVGIAAVGGIFYFSMQGGPEMTFVKIKDAIDDKDLDSFKKYVDEDAIINSLVDQYITFAMAQNNGEVDIATGLIAFMKPSIVSIVKEQVENSIVTGNHNIPNTIEGISTEVMGLLAIIKGDGAVFKGLKEKVVDEHQASLTFQLQLEGSDRIDDLIVKLRKTDDGWQVYDVKNVSALLESYMKTLQ